MVSYIEKAVAVTQLADFRGRTSVACCCGDTRSPRVLRSFRSVLPEIPCGIVSSSCLQQLLQFHELQHRRAQVDPGKQC